jgi:tripartite-type tricarboxylate transporter receptor subunit TctC
VLSKERSPFARDVPTLGESGLAGLDQINVVGWSGMLAPKGTPAAVTARISDAVQTAMADPGMQQYLGTQSLRSYPRHTPEFMAGFMRTELASWRETGRLAGVTG